MKKNLILLLFIFLCKVSFAQINVTYATNDNNRTFEIQKKKDGNYLVIIQGWDKTKFPNNIYSKIFVMNNNCRFVDSTILSSSTHNLYLNRLMPVSEGYVGLVGADSRSNSGDYTWIVRFNERLVRVRDTILPSKLIQASAFSNDKDSNIIFTFSGIPRIMLLNAIFHNANISQKQPIRHYFF